MSAWLSNHLSARAELPRPLSGAHSTPPPHSPISLAWQKAGDVVGKRSLANTGQAVEMLPSPLLQVG